jgi:photosystem II stability/assembly factor-like uncharacterized protein
MKVFILIMIPLLTICLFAQEGWIDQTPPLSLPGLYGVHALDSENIWVVGEQGTILKSTDGGLNWNLIPINTHQNLIGVEFINPDTGWVIVGSSSDSSIYRTVDGGNSWEFQSLWSVAPSENLTLDIDFIKDSESDSVWGYITGGLGDVWRTTDYGDTWEKIRGNCGNGNFWSCCFTDQETGWFVGTASATNPCTILNMSDGGNIWIEQTNPADQPLREVCFADPLRGLAVGLVGTILYTSDGGQNWETRPNNGYRWQSAFLTQSGKAWAVGDKGNINYSADWGYSWEAQESNADAELWEVYFVNDDEGWIVGGGIGKPGIILHTTNGGVVQIDSENNSNLPGFFSLEQNYPNPFNPTTTIKFQISAAKYTTLKVYTVTGYEVSSLISKRLNPGTYTYTFDGSNLASGIYYYQLDAGQYREVKKMILLK